MRIDSGLIMRDSFSLLTYEEVNCTDGSSFCEEDSVSLNLPVGCLKTISGLELVLRCEPGTYQSYC